MASGNFQLTTDMQTDKINVIFRITIIIIWLLDYWATRRWGCSSDTGKQGP